MHFYVHFPVSHHCVCNCVRFIESIASVWDSDFKNFICLFIIYDSFSCSTFYKLRFTGYAKEWMKNHKLSDNQTFKEDEESTTVSFSSSQFDKVLELILSWGRQAEPLAPARHVKRWKEEVLAMAEKVKES